MSGRRLLAVVGATAVAAVVAVVVMAAVGAFDSGSSGPAHAQGGAGANANVIHRIYQRQGRSVYFVQASGPQGAGTGTAWLFDAKGHLVTNEHVVSGGTDLALRVGENGLVAVKLVGEDPSTDLAVLQADPKALTGGDPLRLGDASEVFVGQPVVAIGNPFGLEGTVTSGIVSAKARVLQAPNGYPIANAIQTDAAINPGNSGGPLVDLEGRVIGVNSQIATGGAGQSAGIGFAVPVDTVERVAQELIEHGHVDRAYLGVSTVGLTAELAQRLGLDVQSGALVLEVAGGGPADRGGLRGSGSDAATGALVAGGDVITSIDGQKVAGPNDVAQVVGAKRSGDSAKVTYLRGGDERTVEVRLSSQPTTGP
jgi:S1-C subfamily serine protease